MSSPWGGTQTSQQSCWSSWPKMNMAAQHSWGVPVYCMRQYQAGLETIPQAHLQILPLHPVHGLCWCQCESFLLLCAIEFFFFEILLCCTPGHNQHAHNCMWSWCWKGWSIWWESGQAGAIAKIVGVFRRLCWGLVLKNVLLTRVVMTALAPVGVGRFRSSSLCRTDPS